MPPNPLEARALGTCSFFPDFSYSDGWTVSVTETKMPKKVSFGENKSEIVFLLVVHQKLNESLLSRSKVGSSLSPNITSFQ